jgi:hypothetical protein
VPAEGDGVKATELLRAFGVYNTHQILERFAPKGMDVACIYYPAEPRACRGRATKVYSPSHKTDPEAAWYDRGQKSFGGERERSMAEAVAWASQRYGITGWATCPTDRTAKIPATVRERALDAVRK